MAGISGIGALMIYANDPVELAQWYSNNLGFKFERNTQDDSHYGELSDSATKITVYLAILPAKHELSYGNRGVMINYKVNGFDAFVADLEKKGVSIDSRRGDGASKFAVITDPEGNAIELWSGT